VSDATEANLISQPCVRSVLTLPIEGWDAPGKGDLVWQTLFSGEVTPTAEMCAGVAILEPGGTHKRHRHAEVELYFVIEGTGQLSLDDAEHEISTGSAAYIPGNCWHGLVNTGTASLRIFYVFPTGRFSNIEYFFE
jgi:quercetin dioxygenase-like cupin family protein